MTRLAMTLQRRFFHLATYFVAIACVNNVWTGRAIAQNIFESTVLVANRASYNPTAFVDPHMENAWGIAMRPPGVGGHIWVSNARNASTSLYFGDVNGIPLQQDGLKIVYMDGPQYSYEGGLPQVTGQVYNAASDIPGQPIEFPVSGPSSNWSSGVPVSLGATSGAAKFVFVTKDGTINAWRANTANSMDSAVIVKDYSDHGADQPPLGSRPDYLPAYTGVAMTTTAFTLDGLGNHVADNRLYVSDFRNNAIQVFNNQWSEITSSVPFERPVAPPPADVDSGFSPFNIQSINDHLYVAYAIVDQTTDEPAFDITGEGHGHIVEYDRNGHIIREFADTGLLNSPWGMTIAPEGFGNFGGDLLVANFGDGTIAAFDPNTGAFNDYLRDAAGDPISLEGIWGLAFGNGVSLGDAMSLYYTAGPNTEQDGIFGRVNVVPEPASVSFLAGAMMLGMFRRRSLRHQAIFRSPERRSTCAAGL